MNNNDFEKNFNDAEYNDCVLKGICSISPILSHMQAVMLIYLRELAFYLLRLNKLGFSNAKIKKDFIEATSLALTNLECSQENINKLVSIVYEDLFQAKELYKTVCKNNNITPDFLKTKLKLSQSYSINNAIMQGKKSFINFSKNFDDKKKKNIDLMLVILKSICMYIIELQELNINIDNYYEELLKVIGIENIDIISSQQLEEMIEKYTILDHELMKEVFIAKKTNFGNFIKTEISSSIRPGKAILVAGANIKELDSILKATQDKGIDVYTHGQMITGHTLEKFKNYPHLAGHYGKGIEHALQDFISFPGVIFLTKFSLHKLQNVYQSNIFTSDTITPAGLTQIANNDFEPLIKAALSTDGFEEFIEKENIKVNFDEEEFFQKINEIAEKIEKNEIKNIFFIGVTNKANAQEDYFRNFLNLIKDNDFVISFSYAINRKNILHFNIDYAFPLVYKTLDIFAQKKSLSDLKPKVLFTRCEPHTIPNLFYMKFKGINDIYFDSCSPNFINPALVDYIKEMLNIKNYTNPENDIKEMTAD